MKQHLRPISLLAAILIPACDVEDASSEDIPALEDLEDEDGLDSEGDTGELEDDSWGADEDFSDDPDPQGALFPANWELGMNYAGGANGQRFANIFWRVNGALPRDYTVCWKDADASGSVCSGVEVVHTATTANTGAGGFTGRVVPLVCDETYEVRVKRGLSHDTRELYFDCPCSDPCPDGGWFDGANCQIGQAPSGTTAFVWGNGYYHTPLPGNVCPLQGSYYDGANCRVSTVPSGVDPFISNNYWYYVRECLP